jgi:HEPN domain-containing protein
MKNNLPKTNLPLAEEWFAKATDDELSIKDILNNREGSPNTVCFLCQQMAEKYLKGYLVFYNIEFPKIHQLDKLINICKKTDRQFEKLKEEAELLSEFYISARYPGDYSVFSFADAEKTYKAALRIKEFVIQRTIL